MSSVVADHITTLLCKNQGCLDFESLDSSLRQRFTVANEVFLNVLSDNSRFVIIEGDKPSVDSVLSPNSVIIAKTPLRVCQDLSFKCGQCENLHLCRYFVCGKCRYGAKCKNSHELATVHNKRLLQKVGLQHLVESELFQLLLQNDPYLLPEVCSHYNHGNEEHGSCKFKAACTNLHICQHFLQDSCKFGANCKRAHTFANCMNILNGRGLSPENLRILHKIYKNRFLITQQKEKPVKKIPEKERPKQSSTNPISDADRNGICLFFIRRGCSFKEKCVRVHYHLPYRWQVLDKDGVTWKDLPNGEDIEKAFCNPINVLNVALSDAGSHSVNFITMTCRGSSVRRLSTASAISKPPHFILTTEWRWYWRDNDGDWIEYGQGEDARLLASITSQTLENLYLADTSSEIPFSSPAHKYILSFKGMYQQNIRHKTKREIRRRPRFVSAQEVESKLKSVSPETSSSASVDIPNDWDKAAVDSLSYKLVPLANSGSKYTMVEKLFKRTMTHRIIHSIKRVQNPSLWKMFQWQKEQMKERNGGKEVFDRYLFHGTDPSLVDAICEQNFDWRICGVHGTLYGKGSYFARDAVYSDKYASSSNGRKTMFLALVLVGESTRGNSTYLRPPQKGSNKGFYDSCVDNESNPAIFVIFEKYQIYPEFLIEYS
ncbi:protein mono-ADP-ribosyltransferase PARP12-like isoform X2 [Chanos chanos]|uniref:Protein mono-ADP-ribosyltransferase PARP12-like isoform X2 n=1 Tax=Chanos chanos TaxID=29144 RepID=A0A6J2WMR2_CHACN|nr:protein mono-ADP-ribosyltransferase PARP12-like isoform X2 [Chanos chanos]